MKQKSKKLELDTLTRLERELENFKKLLGAGYELNVVWKPSASKLSGEVSGSTVYIYEADESVAIQTLLHETIDYVLTKTLVSPLISIINTLIKQREREVYEQKEKLVEKLCETLKKSEGGAIC